MEEGKEEKECLVCRETFSLRIRKPICCPQCKFVCCLSCFRQFLLTSVTEPACMSCKVQHNYDFLLEHLPGVFWHREYKDFRKNLLLSREESLLPDTQDCVVRINMRNNFFQYMEQYRKKLLRMQRHYARMTDRCNQMTELINQEKHGTMDIPNDHPLFLHFDENGDPIVDKNNDLVCLLKRDATEEENIARAKKVAPMNGWIHKCPREDCRGFLRGEQSRCPVCQSHVCPECLVIIDTDTEERETHECKKEDVDTVQLLRQNTKSCPTCAMTIYKISGCDQMWCTQCRTPFSWKTGQKINQTIHNPHYYEWMQQRNQAGGGGGDAPRELMDIPCGGLPHIHQLQVFPQCLHGWVYNLHQKITHTEHVILHRSQAICTANENCKELRIHYLMNKISREDWRTELYKREKIRQKHTMYGQILQTYVAVSSDWLRRIVMDFPPLLRLIGEIEEIMEFFLYINRQIGHLNQRFKSALSNIHIATEIPRLLRHLKDR